MLAHYSDVSNIQHQRVAELPLYRKVEVIVSGKLRRLGALEPGDAGSVRDGRIDEGRRSPRGHPLIQYEGGEHAVRRIAEGLRQREPHGVSRAAYRNQRSIGSGIGTTNYRLLVARVSKT